MFNATKSEIIRIASLRSSLVYAILLTGALYGPIALLVMFFSSQVDSAIDPGALLIGTMFFFPISIIFGAAATASEVRFGSTSLNFLVQPNRWTSYVARLIANWLFISLNYAFGLGLAVAIANFYPKGVQLGDNGAKLMLLAWAVALFWNTIGVTCGFIFRSVAMAVTLPLLWITVAETMLMVVPVKFFNDLGTWAPYYLSNSALPSALSGNETIHTPGQMVAVLAAILVAFVASGWTLHTRRDVLA